MFAAAHCFMASLCAELTTIDSLRPVAVEGDTLLSFLSFVPLSIAGLAAAMMAHSAAGRVSCAFFASTCRRQRLARQADWRRHEQLRRAGRQPLARARASATAAKHLLEHAMGRSWPAAHRLGGAPRRRSTAVGRLRVLMLHGAADAQMAVLSDGLLALGAQVDQPALAAPAAAGRLLAAGGGANGGCAPSRRKQPGAQQQRRRRLAAAAAAAVAARRGRSATPPRPTRDGHTASSS